MLPAGVIIPFDGNNADIPAGFVRDTRFDGRIPKHSPTGDGQLSGASTHTHTDSHTHPLGAHTHPFSLNRKDKDSNSRHVDNPPREYAGAHTHSQATSGGINTAVSGENNNPVSAATNIPASRTVIYIRSQKLNRIPAGGMVYREDKNSKLTLYDIGGRFLIGADTGANAGSDIGTNNHIHSWQHNHSAAHAHAEANSGYAPSGAKGAHNGSDTYAGWNHYHTTYFDTNNLITSTATLTTSNAEVNIPPYHELYLYRADKVSSLSEGDIAITTDSVPKGWELISQDEFYVKPTTATSLGSGGADYHTHTNLTHGHDTITHAHTGSTNIESSSSTCSKDPIDDGSAGCVHTNHRHSVTVSDSNMSIGQSATNIGQAQMLPPTISVKYIRATKAAVRNNNAALLLKLM